MIYKKTLSIKSINRRERNHHPTAMDKNSGALNQMSPDTTILFEGYELIHIEQIKISQSSRPNEALSITIVPH